MSTIVRMAEARAEAENVTVVDVNGGRLAIGDLVSTYSGKLYVVSSLGEDHVGLDERPLQDYPNDGWALPVRFGCAYSARRLPDGAQEEYRAGMRSRADLAAAEVAVWIGEDGHS